MPLAALPLLPQELAHLLELLFELLLFFLRRLLPLHVIEVLGALIEIIRRGAEVLHQVLGGLLELAIQSIELASCVPLLVAFAIEALEFALLLLEQAALFIRAAVAELLLLLEDLVRELLPALIEVLGALLRLLRGLLDGLAHLLELGLVERDALPRGAHLLGQLAQRVARLVELGVHERVPDRPRQIGLLELLTHRLELLFERLLVGGSALEQLALQRLQPAERLGSIEPTTRDVVHQAIEVVDGRLGIAARIVLLELLEKIFDVLEIVRGHLDRVNRPGVKDRDVGPHLEEERDDERSAEGQRRSKGPRPADRDREARLGRRREGDGVLDRGFHEGGARRPLREGERVCESVMERVKAIQRARPGPRGQAPGPCQAGGHEGRGDRKSEDAASDPFGQKAQLASCDVHDGEDQPRAEALRAHAKGSIEAETLLGAIREPANPVDPVLLTAHPEVLTSMPEVKFRPILAPVFQA